MKTKDEKANVIKSCYSHMGGKFGARLTTRFEELGWINT
jgi:hypothetical protein